ncbi:MAG: ATP synthase subunit I [Candidatus Accumulibacter sp.]|jgi:ATP synthase protein I|nr:ATP synthase subunit I [Accumulibacter sp.]
MFRAVFPQVAIAVLVVAGAGYFAGGQGVVSAMLGGFACFVPSLLFTLYLRYASCHRESSMLVRFFIGELAKIVLSIGFLFLAMKIYDPHWLALFAGMALGVMLALQASFLAIRKKN